MAVGHFEPDILVEEANSSKILLIVEVKMRSDDGTAEKQLKRYMRVMSCPVGLMVTPNNLAIYKNYYSGGDDLSIEKVADSPVPASFPKFESNRNESSFVRDVQAWLESLPNYSEKHLSTLFSEKFLDYVLPSLSIGRVSSARPLSGSRAQTHQTV